MTHSTGSPRRGLGRILITLAVAACLAASWPSILSTPAALATSTGPTFSNGMYTFATQGCQS